MEHNVILKLNKIVFWWYYKRVPKFFHKWTILKSIRLLVDNYEHQEFVIKGNREVISNAIKTERDMQKQIFNLKMKLQGVSQEKIDPLNKMFGTDLKGISKEEREN
ncbi:hypothetical protein [Aquimarina algiphila]|uniref:Uncharacterized protein n=1 Tax=Aquimarina algiphila TaxID=2047982 RepID=A0A554VE24_9FLAO|nr:hypothetical protein [Aquimarina algiphila]TSE05234.1 hypothetical protein FOF46_23510 [Aquimarina algiphila]